jgi:hypothetical protein
MTTPFALSKLISVILRLWGVDTALQPERRNRPDDLIIAAALLSYARSCRRSGSLENKPTRQATLRRDRLLKIRQQGETR